MEKKFDWIPFHEALANKLLAYKNNRAELFDMIRKLSDENPMLKYLHFENEDWWATRNYEIDPFSIYAMFNRSLKLENRIEIVKSLAEKLDITTPIPSKFTGIPVMNNQRAFFGGNDEVWSLFETAIKCADTHTFTKDFEELFEKAIAVNGNGLAMITMGLFWIRPYTFLNLDSQNKEVLSNSNNGLESVTKTLPRSIKKHTPTGHEYVSMCEEIKRLIDTENFTFKSIPEISNFAWKSNLSKDDIRTLANTVVLYYARLHSDDLEYQQNCTKYLRLVSEHSGIPYNTLRQNKDSFDPLYENGRIGYHQKPLENKNKSLYELYQRYIDIPTLDLKNIAMSAMDSMLKKCSGNQKTDTIANEITPRKKYWVYGTKEKKSQLEDFYKDGVLGIGWEELGDFTKYNSKEDIVLELQNCHGENKSYKNNSLAVWQFAKEMQIGDVIYFKTDRHSIGGRGIITSKYIYDKTRGAYPSIHTVDWTHKEEHTHPGQAVAKTFTDITQYTEYVEKLELLFLGEDIEEEAMYYPTYTKENFLSEVFMSDDTYETLSTLLSRKKNIILQGAPGVGKTFAAKRLAYSLMEEKDTSRVEMIQFHQSYSYEDFIMGYRPDDNGFKLVHGAFYKFCKKAQDDNERDYFFIIDEINRGNLSKIFGELFMLIEHDKRDERNSMRLLYVDEQFYIPSNVHIIGMMNTADRSLAMLDYALRRRFAFFEMPPAFDSDGFKLYQEDISNNKFNQLIDVVKALNTEIKNDVSLGAGFRIGHSYFMTTDMVDDSWLHTVVEYEIIPLLQEYWFDENSKLENWSAKLRGAIL